MMGFIADIRNKRNADKHYWKGVGFQKKRMYSEAMNEYLQAVAHDPEYYQAYCNLASVIQKELKADDPLFCKKMEQSIGYYKKALGIKPDDAITMFDLGTIYYLHSADQDTAFDYFARSIQADRLFEQKVREYLQHVSYSASQDMDIILGKMTWDRARQAFGSSDEPTEAHPQQTAGHRADEGIYCKEYLLFPGSFCVMKIKIPGDWFTDNYLPVGTSMTWLVNVKYTPLESIVEDNKRRYHFSNRLSPGKREFMARQGEMVGGWRSPQDGPFFIGMELVAERLPGNAKPALMYGETMNAGARNKKFGNPKPAKRITVGGWEAFESQEATFGKMIKKVVMMRGDTELRFTFWTRPDKYARTEAIFNAILKSVDFSPDLSG